LYNWTDKQLDEQYNYFKIYKEMNLITDSSILAYVINMNGSIGLNPTYSTVNAEEYQYKISNNLKLPAYPCIFCDATIGFCNNLNERLLNVFNNQKYFIDDLIFRSIKYNWSGYTIDFEPDGSIDSVKSTNLIVDLANQLNKYNKKLYIWTNFYINSLYPFNMSHLIHHNNIIFITMNTYNLNYDLFINEASNAMINSRSLNNIGFGLLTYDNSKIINEDSISKIINWLNIFNTSTISLWASKIPPNWYIPINNYLFI
jgi:hypothetical protein